MRICGSSLPHALISEPRRCEKLALISAICLSILAIGAFAYASATSMHPITHAIGGVGAVSSIGVGLLHGSTLSSIVQEAKKYLLLKEALKVVWKTRIPPESGVKIFESGTSKVFEVKGLPGLVFKVHDEEPKVDEIAHKYISIAEKARRVCQKHGLKHIYIPPCGFHQIGEMFVVWQEKVPNQGDFQEQAGFFAHAFKDAEQREHMLDCFRDLTKIVCKVGISDIKANNLLYTLDGKIALIDLDDHDAVVGLCRGWAEDPDNGVLQIIPSKYFKEFVDLANTYLSEEDRGRLAENLNELQQKVDEKAKEKKDYALFLEGNQITSVRDRVKIGREIEGSEEVKMTAQSIIKSLNAQLEINADNRDLETGREVQVSYVGTSSMYGRVCQDIPASNWIPKFNEALEALQAAGVIFSYEKERHFGMLTVKC